MIKIDHTASYTHSAEEVFAAVVDFPAFPEWQPDVLQAKVVSAEPIGLGTQVAQIRKVMGRQVDVTLNITEFDSDRLVTLTSAEGTSPAVQQSYLIESTDEGCRLSFHLQLDGVPRMAEHLARTQITHQAKRVFQSLGELVARRSRDAS